MVRARRARSLLTAASVLACALACGAPPAAAGDGVWTYEPPNPESADAAEVLHRAEITVEGANAALAWVPDPGTWRLFLLQEGEALSERRRVSVAYGGDRREFLNATNVTATLNALGNTDLRVDLAPSDLEHLQAGNTLLITEGAETFQLPLSGSRDAILETDAARATPAPAPLVRENAAGETCDDLASWGDDAEAVSQPVPEADLDTRAAILACYEAHATEPETARYLFQLGRALRVAGAAGAEGFLREAADAGYAAAADYLDTVQ